MRSGKSYAEYLYVLHAAGKAVSRKYDAPCDEEELRRLARRVAAMFSEAVRLAASGGLEAQLNGVEDASRRRGLTYARAYYTVFRLGKPVADAVAHIHMQCIGAEQVVAEVAVDVVRGATV